MNIDDIKKEWKKDSPIRKDKLDDELCNIPVLLYKYQDFLYIETKKFKKRENENKCVYLTLFKYYNGYLDKESLEKIKRKQFSQKILKADIKTYIEADEIYHLSTDLLEESFDIVEFLKQIIKHLENRSYNIKSTIDYLKWTNGMM